jgi:hypothetical protein
MSSQTTGTTANFKGIDDNLVPKIDDVSKNVNIAFENKIDDAIVPELKDINRNVKVAFEGEVKTTTPKIEDINKNAAVNFEGIVDSVEPDIKDIDKKATITFEGAVEHNFTGVEGNFLDENVSKTITATVQGNIDPNLINKGMDLDQESTMTITGAMDSNFLDIDKGIGVVPKSEKQPRLEGSELFRKIAGRDAVGPDEPDANYSFRSLSAQLKESQASYQAAIELQEQSLQESLQIQVDRLASLENIAAGVTAELGPSDMYSPEKQLEFQIEALTQIPFIFKNIEKIEKKIAQKEYKFDKFIQKYKQFDTKIAALQPPAESADIRDIARIDSPAPFFEKDIGKQERIEKVNVQYLNVLNKFNTEKQKLIDDDIDMTDEKYKELAERELALLRWKRAEMVNIEKQFRSEEEKLWMGSAEGKIKVVGGMMGDMAELLMQGSKEQFEIGKKMAVAQALIDTYLGAQKAFTSLAGIPYIGPALGAAAAATAIAAGMARINMIRSQEFQGQAHGGLDYVPKTGTYLLEEGERVVKKQDAKKVDSNSGDLKQYFDFSNSTGVDLGEVERAAEIGARKGAQGGYDMVLQDVKRGGPIRTELR